MKHGFLLKEHRPIASVDAVIFTFEKGLKVLLWRRSKQPFGGELALCGGYVHVDKDVNAEASMRRILLAKAGLEGIVLEQFHTFSGQRDPRDWSISIAYFALCPREKLGELRGEVELLPVESLGQLAFDHNQIVDAALERLTQQSQFSTLPAAMLPSQFTLAELQSVYEAALRRRFDPSSFRRKIAERRLLDPVNSPTASRAQGRPAQLWQLHEPYIRFDRQI